MGGMRVDPSKLAFAFPFVISNGGDVKASQGPRLKDSRRTRTNGVPLIGKPREVAPDRLSLTFTPLATGAVVEEIVRLPLSRLSKVQNTQAGSATKLVIALSAAKEVREREPGRRA